MKTPLPPSELKKILVAENLIAGEKFDELLAEAERKNQSILDVLTSEKVGNANYLGDLVSKALGIPRVNFSERKIEPEIVKQIPEDIARAREVIVFNRESDGAYD